MIPIIRTGVNCLFIPFHRSKLSSNYFELQNSDNMKKLFLLLIPLLFIFKGCEFFDLEMREVTYLLESNRKYVYESNLQAGQLNNDGRDLNRADFNIPNTAVIKKFKIKNIWLSIIPLDGNICTEGSLNYTLNIDNSSLVQYENKFPISSVPTSEFIINNEFSENLASLRQKVEQAIINDQSVRLGYVFGCEFQDASTHVIMIIRFTVDVEYLNCEEVFSGSDLPEC